MEYTQKQVVRILRRSKRDVTERKLTDWIQKELLPSPERGKGSGKAPKYYWADPSVVKQAAIIHDLFYWNGRVEWFAVPLWLLGHSVSSDKVQGILLMKIENELTALTQGETDPEELDERIKDVAGNILFRMKYSGKTRGNLLPLDPDEQLKVLVVFFHLLADPGYMPSEDLLPSVLSRLPSVNQEPGAEQETLSLIEYILFICSHLSLPCQRDAVINATEKDWHQAQQDFIDILYLLREFHTLTQVKFPLIPEWMKYNALVKGGLTLIPLLLALRLDGYGDWLENAFAIADQMLNDPEFKERSEEVMSSTRIPRP